MQTETTGRFAGFFQSPGSKLVILGLLIVILLIPLAMVRGVVHERHQRSIGATYEVGNSWGGAQSIMGPVLVVPYQVPIVEQRSDHEIVRHMRDEVLFLLPEMLTIDGSLEAQTRRRGIYEVSVYGASVELGGSFAPKSVARHLPTDAIVDYDEAYLAIGITGLRGLRRNPKLSWNGSVSTLEPGALDLSYLGSGVHAKIALDPAADSTEFSLSLELNGSQTFGFAPVARETVTRLRSDWPHPSFAGGFLPETHAISETGFEAEWRIPHVARGFPNYWLNRSVGADSVQASLATVAFYVPVDYYVKSERAVKYGILFIVFTFTAYFLFEVLLNLRLHAANYLLVGLALLLFYVLLMSMSEHFGFLAAYLLSSTGTIGLISLYSAAVLRSWKRSGVIATFLFVLYALLYALLRSEDYALLLGSLALFAGLAAVMYFTRELDWRSAAPISIKTETKV